MKYLTLIRHGKSSHTQSGTRDIERPLNDRGVHDADLMGNALASLLPSPGSVLGSTAVRVRQTLEHLYRSARGIGFALPDAELYDELYLSDADTMWDYIYSAFMENDEVWLCAHNPGITEAIELYAGVSIGNVPTLGVGRIAFEEVLAGRTVGDILFYDVPKNHYR